MDVSWEEAKSVASDHKEWRSLVTQCSGAGKQEDLMLKVVLLCSH